MLVLSHFFWDWTGTGSVTLNAGTPTVTLVPPTAARTVTRVTRTPGRLSLVVVAPTATRVVGSGGVAGRRQARAGLALSGVTYAGWTSPRLTVRIAGVDRTALVTRDEFSIVERVDGSPALCTFTVRDLQPTVGQDVLITYATPDEYLFGGTILQAEATLEGPDPATILWRCAAVDYTWLLNRYDLVLARYRSVGLSTIVADILARFTNGRFRLGYMPQTLGTYDLDFTFVTVSEAINRIAKLAHLYWEVTPQRIVNVFSTYQETSLPALTSANLCLDGIRYSTDLSQIRTRALFEGRGTSVTGTVLAGATSIPVEELSAFSATGGQALSGQCLITYSGRSDASGPGFLMGVSGVTHELASGDSITVIVEHIDSAAEASLASLLGDGLSGQARHYLRDGRLSLDEAAARANTDTSFFNEPLRDLVFTYIQPPRWLRVGRTLTAFITSPLSITGTFRIQSIETTVRTNVSGDQVDLRRQVSMSRFSRSLTDLLRQLPG